MFWSIWRKVRRAVLIFLLVGINVLLLGHNLGALRSAGGPNTPRVEESGMSELSPTLPNRSTRPQASVAMELAQVRPVSPSGTPSQPYVPSTVPTLSQRPSAPIRFESKIASANASVAPVRDRIKATEATPRYYQVQLAKPVDAISVDNMNSLQTVDIALASALESASSSEIYFRTPAWTIPFGSVTEAIPYVEHFRHLNRTHGEYIEHLNTIFISACDAWSLDQQWVIFGDAREIVSFKQAACDDTTAAVNAAAKHLIVFANYPEGGYFGHAMDNVLPRLASMLAGAQRTGHEVSLVLPDDSRQHFSTNTELLLNALNISLRSRIPLTPHRAVGVSTVATWDRILRRSLRDQLHRSIFKGITAASCKAQLLADVASLENGSQVSTLSAGAAIFLSRRKGAKRGREVIGSEFLESALRQYGFDIVTNIAAIPLLSLATRLFRDVCYFGGFAGTALLNMIFLSPGATLIEFNSHGIYADYWQWAHALGLRFRHIAPPKVILDRAYAEKLARDALLEEPL